MIYVIGKTSDDRPVYGATLRGIGLLAGGFGAVATAIVIGVLALSQANTAITLSNEGQRARIQFTCEESNRRHQEVGPEVVALLTRTPPKDPAEHQAQSEAILALEGGTQPKTPNGERDLLTIQGFVQIFAPAYDCQQRVAKLTKLQP